MKITYENGRIWHSDCSKNRWNSGIMTIEKDEPGNRRTLMKCLHCEQKGYLPYRTSGCVTVEEVKL